MSKNWTFRTPEQPHVEHGEHEFSIGNIKFYRSSEKSMAGADDGE
jgi:hypothetical protein